MQLLAEGAEKARANFFASIHFHHIDARTASEARSTFSGAGLLTLRADCSLLTRKPATLPYKKVSEVSSTPGIVSWLEIALARHIVLIKRVVVSIQEGSRGSRWNLVTPPGKSCSRDP